MFSVDPDTNTLSGTKELWCCLGWLRAVWKLWFGEEMVVTSLNDGEHSKDSDHYKDNAADIRTRHIYLREKGNKLELPYAGNHPAAFVSFCRMLQGEMGPRGLRVHLHPDWDKVGEREPPHLHISFRLRQGDVWLKQAEP